MSKCIRQQQFIMLLYLRHFTIKIVAQTLVNSYYNASIKLFGKCFSPDRKVCIFLVKWPAMIFYVQVFDKEYVCFTEVCSKNEIHFEGEKITFCPTSLLAKFNQSSSVSIFSKSENSPFFGIFSTKVIYLASSESYKRLVIFSQVFRNLLRIDLHYGQGHL